MYNRRQFGRLAIGAVPTALAFAKLSKIHGVEVGVAGYSYNTLPRLGLLDAIIASMKDAGIGSCLLYAPATEPVDLADKARPAGRGGFGGPGGGRGGSGGGRAGGFGGSGGRGPGGGGRAPMSPEQAAAVEALHQWHLTVPPTYYTAIRRKFADSGLTIDGFDVTSTLTGNVTDDDITKVVEATKALGADRMMCAVVKSVAKRIAPIAEKHNMKVGLQGRPNMNATDPDAMAKPADFEEAVGYSKNFGTSIDVGDATGGGWNVLKFIQDTHSSIFALNLKDRTKANVSMPWGQGDSQIKEILQIVRDKKYPVRCYIDCDFATAEGTTRVADVKRCMEFAKSALS